jgi:mRNA interferase RelE/StbE
MGYGVELSSAADRERSRLEVQHRKRILKFLHEHAAKLDDPRSVGQALRGSPLGEFWRYRVGGYRLLCKIEDDRRLVLIPRVGHRTNSYR